MTDTPEPDGRDAIWRAITEGDYSGVTLGTAERVKTWLRGELQKGIHSGAARPVDVEDLKRRGRERLAAARLTG